MTNLEYIFKFAEKHNFPQTNCEVKFKAVDDGSGRDIYTTDDDIISVKFDKSLVANELKIADIRFDIDSNFPEDVFDVWQNDDPKISFMDWIALGRYMPTIIQNAEYLDELESLTKEIEMKLERLFPDIGLDYGDSDYDEEYDEDEDDEDDED